MHQSPANGVDCRSLTEMNASVRWMSAAFSRIVANPNLLPPVELPEGVSPSLPLDMAYYSGEHPIPLPHFWSWRSHANVSLNTTSTTWAPHALEVEAECSGLKVRTTQCLSDESTLAELLQVTEGDAQTLVLAGQFPEGKLEWDQKSDSISLRTEYFSAVITLSRSARWIAIFPTWADFFADKGWRTSHPGVWAIAFDGVKAGDEIVVTARFSPKGELAPEASALDPQTFREALAKSEADWNRKLSLVPRPLDFQLHIADSKGIDSDAIRRMYYKAWTFIFANILPPMPENGYPYPQVACGKPSLWAEGHEKSRPSAQWESMIGMQFLSQVDPDTAWSAFEGMMTLVDGNGIMGGEGLPSRHAQTAWMLYIATLDKDHLRGTYPAVKRMLLWKISDPRWVFKEQVPEGFKDQEFVVHALIDADYAIRISEALDMPEEANMWRERISALAGDYAKCFWETPGGESWRWFDANTGTRTQPDHSWNLQGLALPPSAMREPERESLLRLFKSMYNPNAPFAGTELCKHPTYNFTMRGVWQYGLANEAAGMAEAIMRDVTMAGDFAECYSFTFPPALEGVWPSLFGVANIIDGVLWHNGVIVGDGLPIIAHLPNAAGVENVRLRGGTMSVRFTDDEVDICGPGLSGLNMPDGFVASTLDDGTQAWHGKLPVGKQIASKK